jgi:predicted transcriptional regulator
MIHPMKPTKALTIRLSAEQADALETVARVQNQAISEVIRSAISDHIEHQRKDPRFQDGLRQRIERAQKLIGDR